MLGLDPIPADSLGLTGQRASRQGHVVATSEQQRGKGLRMRWSGNHYRPSHIGKLDPAEAISYGADLPPQVVA